MSDMSSMSINSFGSTASMSMDNTDMSNMNMDSTGMNNMNSFGSTGMSNTASAARA